VANLSLTASAVLSALERHCAYDDVLFSCCCWLIKYKPPTVAAPAMRGRMARRASSSPCFSVDAALREALEMTLLVAVRATVFIVS